uniref:Uncharacterized protein n=1 Tax=Glossina palpalis gambiensis TaxID=67801 RepID=A0A1B0BH39_9MUSC
MKLEPVPQTIKLCIEPDSFGPYSHVFLFDNDDNDDDDDDDDDFHDDDNDDDDDDNGDDDDDVDDDHIYESVHVHVYMYTRETDYCGCCNFSCSNGYIATAPPGGWFISAFVYVCVHVYMHITEYHVVVAFFIS